MNDIDRNILNSSANTSSNNNTPNTPNAITSKSQNVVLKMENAVKQPRNEMAESQKDFY